MTIDTVKLHLKDYSIATDNNLQVQPSSYVAGSGEVISEFPLFRNEEGREFRGSKSYLNTSTLNLTIQPFTRCAEGTTCFVQFSIPKNHYGNNFYSVGEEGSQAVFTKIEKELWENGIHTAISEANLSRIDTFKNIQTEEPYGSYYPLFSTLKARRALQRGYGTTWLVNNTQQEFCIYDKIEEMKHRDIDTAHFPAQTMRFEHRLLNKKKIESVYGFSTVSQLFSGGYPVVKEKQITEWKKSLFSHSVEEVMLLGAGQIEEEMRYFYERYPHYWLERYLRGYGVNYLVERAGIEVVKLALKNIVSDRMKVWRAEKLLEETKKEIDLLKREENSKKTLGTLYMELKEKVCLN